MAKYKAIRPTILQQLPCRTFAPLKFRAFIIFICIILMPKRSSSTPYIYSYSANCAHAYKAYLSLKPDEGDAFIRKEIVANPYNLMATYIADYGDFLTLLFTGDPYQRRQRAAHEEERLDRLEKGSDNDPWKRLTLAGVHLHWALLRVRFGEQLKAATSFRHSYLLLKENAKQFPAFAPNAVLYGTEEAIAGTIPDQYNWLMAIFGMKGNLARGMARLGAYLKTNTSTDAPLHEEAVIYDVYTRFYLGSAQPAVWQIVSNDATFDTRGNLLHAFVRANLALSYRKADVAVSTLLVAAATPGVGAYTIFDYEMGCAQLMRLEPSCTVFLERFAAHNPGKLFTKDALQKAALAYYLKGDKPKAEALRMAVLSQGSLNNDADKQAQRFAKKGKWPHPLLLTAKLLIDGGYSAQALTKLRSTSALAFTDIADRLEYDFRLGRALEETNDAASAVQAYQRVINGGQDKPEYFAARAALQMGSIYEKRGQIADARRYYELCLSMHNHDFQASIDQQAKAGLGRIENR
jgi:tetratricopeptide (TPR) repeat protein